MCNYDLTINYFGQPSQPSVLTHSYNLTECKTKTKTVTIRVWHTKVLQVSKPIYFLFTSRWFWQFCIYNGIFYSFHQSAISRYLKNRFAQHTFGAKWKGLLITFDVIESPLVINAQSTHPHGHRCTLFIENCPRINEKAQCKNQWKIALKKITLSSYFSCKRKETIKTKLTRYTCINCTIKSMTAWFITMLMKW